MHQMILNISDHQENAYLNLWAPLNYLKLKMDSIKFGKDLRPLELLEIVGESGTPALEHKMAVFIKFNL